MRLNWARTARRRAKLGKHTSSSGSRCWTNKLALGAGSPVRTAAAEGEGTGKQPGRPPGRSGNPKVPGTPDSLETPEGWRFGTQPWKEGLGRE